MRLTSFGLSVGWDGIRLCVAADRCLGRSALGRSIVVQERALECLPEPLGRGKPIKRMPGSVVELGPQTQALFGRVLA